MLRFNRRKLIKGLAAILCVASIIWLALEYFIPAPPSRITIAAGIKGGSFEHIADRYRERFARAHVTLNVRLTDGTLGSLKLMEDQNSGVDAAFLFGGMTNGEQLPGLMSLGRISYAPISIFYRGTETFNRLSQLKGKRIAVGVAFGLAATQILEAHGVNAYNSTLVPLFGPPAIKALKDGEVDVIILVIGLGSPTIQSLLHDPTVRLMNLTQAEAITQRFPFLSRLILPQGVVDLEKNVPANDVNLIATTNGVVVRSNLHPEIVDLFMQTMMDEHGAAGIFQHAGDFPVLTDAEFSVSQEARDYYKNGPSLLNRYLPFWITNNVRRFIAVLAAALAIGLPLFNYLPKLYRWFVRERILKLYKRLRIIGDGLQNELNAVEIAALQGELEEIERAAARLRVPMRHSDLFYSFMVHINLVRNRMASRLAEAQKQSAQGA